VWIGPTGLGQPARSDGARETKRGDDLYRGTATQQELYKVQKPPNWSDRDHGD
jgi:hypothetical protein